MDKSRAKQILVKFFWNKYMISLLIFFVWLLFLDQNSIWERWSNQSTIEALESEKDYFLKKIESDKARINELKTNRKNLEKFAREQYLMKKPNEDIFIVIEEE